MWFRNVSFAFLELLIQIDRLGNALCGGNPLATVSGRVGFYEMARANPYWKFLAKVINFAFWPVDGKGHCYQAWKLERDLDHRRGNDVGLFFLSLIIILACIPISVVTYGGKAWVGLRDYSALRLKRLITSWTKKTGW